MMASTEDEGRSVSWAGPMMTLLGGAVRVSPWPMSISLPLEGSSCWWPDIWMSCLRQSSKSFRAHSRPQPWLAMAISA